MIRRRQMTVAQLKRSMDSRFRSVDRRFRSLEAEIRRQGEQTRRHFDMVAESLRDDFRIFADAIARQSERLDQHDVRISRLERRPS